MEDLEGPKDYEDFFGEGLFSAPVLSTNKCITTVQALYFIVYALYSITSISGEYWNVYINFQTTNLY